MKSPFDSSDDSPSYEWSCSSAWSVGDGEKGTSTDEQRDDESRSGAARGGTEQRGNTRWKGRRLTLSERHVRECSLIIMLPPLSSLLSSTHQNVIRADVNMSNTVSSSPPTAAAVAPASTPSDAAASSSSPPPPDVATYVGAIDQGTSSTRFILFDRMGNIVRVAQKELTQIHIDGKPG